MNIVGDGFAITAFDGRSLIVNRFLANDLGY